MPQVFKSQKVNGVINVKPFAYYFYVKMKITVAFDISVPLNVVKSSKAWNQVNQTAQLKRGKKTRAMSFESTSSNLQVANSKARVSRLKAQVE